MISHGWKLLEYRSEQIKLTQLFNLNDDPWEMNNMAGTNTGIEIVTSLRQRMASFRDEWKEEENLFGQLYWQQYRQYEAAELHGVPGPKGSNMQNQVNDWFKK